MKSGLYFVGDKIDTLKELLLTSVCDASDRPQVHGAIAGPQLGEAAHRLVKNSLNIKSYNTHGLSEQTMNRPRSAGPSGSGKYYGEDTSGYYGNYYNHQGMITRPRYPISSNGGPNDRQNFRKQDRSQYHEQFHNVKSGFPALTMEEGVRPRSSAVQSAKAPAMVLLRPPNSGPTTNLQYQFVQNIGPPIPPPKWITPDANGMYAGHQDANSWAAYYDKQMKMAYQVKTRQPQDMQHYGNQ